MRWCRLSLVTSAALLLVGACGESGDDTAATTEDAVVPAPDAPTVTDPSVVTDPSASDPPTGGDTVSITTGQERRLSQDAVVRCNGGGDVYVLDGSRTVAVSGDCGDIEIRTSGATVVVERSNDLDVYGNDSVVSAVDVTDLGVYGDRNTIAVEHVVEIDLEGDGNTVSFQSGSPTIDDEGSGNVIASG